MALDLKIQLEESERVVLGFLSYVSTSACMSGGWACSCTLGDFFSSCHTAWVPVNYRTACAVGLVNTVCTANLDFSTFLYKLGKLIICVCPKVPKQANFAEPFKVCKLKLNCVGIVSPVLWQNYILNTGTVRYKIESQFYAVMFLRPGSSKHNFTVPVLKLLHLQSP